MYTVYSHLNVICFLYLFCKKAWFLPTLINNIIQIILKKTTQYFDDCIPPTMSSIEVDKNSEALDSLKIFQILMKIIVQSTAQDYFGKSNFFLCFQWSFSTVVKCVGCSVSFHLSSFVRSQVHDSSFFRCHCSWRWMWH